MTSKLRGAIQQAMNYVMRFEAGVRGVRQASALLDQSF